MNGHWFACGQLIVGLIVLTVGGDWLVRGAATLAALLRVSALVIGLTVVAFGTSAPELAVSLQAALAGNTDLAVGNVVGSNIFNVLLILGVTALITPLSVASRLILWDVPLMILASLAFWALSQDRLLGRLDGLLLFGGLLAYVAWTIRQSRAESREVQSEFEQALPAPRGRAVRVAAASLLFIIGGLVLLHFGSQWLVAGAVTIAEALGVSQLTIGLTIVAAGTSMPEVVTSIVAGLRGERDIAVGNVVGSNLFNILCVLGLSALVTPHGIDVSQTALRLDIPVMIAVAVLVLPILLTDHCVSRRDGAVFLFYFVAYMSYTVLAAARSQLQHSVVGILTVVVPVTVLTLAVGVYQHLRRG